MSKLSKPRTETPPKKPTARDDVALICGKTQDGKGLHVLRKRGTDLEAGVVQPLEEGKPIHGELVTLRQRGQTPICDVEVHYSGTATPTGDTAAPLPASADAKATSEDRGHPAQVASDSYRKNWDAIWKAKSNKDRLLN